MPKPISFLEFVDFNKAINAARIHLAEAKEHLSYEQYDDAEYSMMMVKAHYKMAIAIKKHMLSSNDRRTD